MMQLTATAYRNLLNRTGRAMNRVAGVDGTPEGWAVVIIAGDQWIIRKVAALANIFDDATDFDIVAVDTPIGLLDAYEVGGRVCDRAARRFLGQPRGSSVFPAPVRPILEATSWEDACVRSRGSAANGKALTKQTFAILPKIREVDALLQTRPEVREVVREVHPEVCFSELAGMSMTHRKASTLGRDERRRALALSFPQLPTIEKAGRDQGLPIEDILDATVACWSAIRLAGGNGRSLPDPVPRDTTGLPMAIWV
jgi:predicted RNase H-like nuclease